MQITIDDHDTYVSSKRDNFRFNIVFFIGTENEHGFSRNLCADFRDILAFMKQTDFITDFEAKDDAGKVECYGFDFTFDQFVREQIMTKEGEKELERFVADALRAIVTEDLVLFQAAAAA